METGAFLGSVAPTPVASCYQGEVRTAIHKKPLEQQHSSFQQYQPPLGGTQGPPTGAARPGVTLHKRALWLRERDRAQCCLSLQLIPPMWPLDSWRCSQVSAGGVGLTGRPEGSLPPTAHTYHTQTHRGRLPAQEDICNTFPPRAKQQAGWQMPRCVWMKVPRWYIL